VSADLQTQQQSSGNCPVGFTVGSFLPPYMAYNYIKPWTLAYIIFLHQFWSQQNL